MSKIWRILTIAGLFSLCCLKSAGQSLNEDTGVLKEKFLFEPPEQEKNIALLQQSDLFDDCPGLLAYRDREFFSAMIDDLGITEEKGEPTELIIFKTSFKEKFLGHVDDACFSKKLRRMFLVVSSDELGGGPFGVLEYDLEKHRASFQKAPYMTLTPFLQFGYKEKDALTIHGNWCGNEVYYRDEVDFLKNGYCFRSGYTYNLNTKKIKKVYENARKANPEAYQHYRGLRDQRGARRAP